MRHLDEPRWAHVGVLLGRSVVVGAVTGVLGGALIFFVFGFIGFTGASFTTRVYNGWEAVVDPGLRKGLAVGLEIAVGLAATMAVWSLLGRRVDPMQARPWLSILASSVVVASNLESLRNTSGWDVAGVATVVGMAVLVGVIVWATSPWALRAAEA